MKPSEGRKRVVIEAVTPRVDCGRHPARRFLGDRVTVSAALFADGHDHVSGHLLYRHRKDRRWRTVPLLNQGNDMWSASFKTDRLGQWQFALAGWIDPFDTWTADLRKRLEAQPKSFIEGGNIPNVSGQDIPLALLTGAALIARIATRAKGAHATVLTRAQRLFEQLASEHRPFYDFPVQPSVNAIAALYPDLELATRTEDLPLWVDRERARYSTWYELFPRSASPEPGRHGTFADVQLRLPAIAAMGFDVLYLPPISPIGEAFRKGPNNSVTAAEGDEGSPWAIGSTSGGHKAIHPALGTLEDFQGLVAAARDHGMELALDIAFQCSPDHPWVKQHPTWFTIRPDGSIQYAENPPKKYQDIYPLNFESADWRALWENLYDVFDYWIRQGVRIFRVDNPHTKALPFWEWVIAEIQKTNPDIIFLAEAFTRPHVMYSLAKSGFTQSYTYFTWRTEKEGLQAYFEEITKPPVSDFFTPNLWPNTPDILHASLQTGGRPAFMQRLILAATLGASYGIYGPAYELGENLPARPGSEEYLDSEKYQIRHRDLSAPHSLVPLITRINHIRRENIALQADLSLHFHSIDNPQMLCYSKRTVDSEAGIDSTILVAINLDPHNEQAGWVGIDLDQLGIQPNETFDVEDLLTGKHYTWHDRRNYVALRPEVLPAHILRVTRPNTSSTDSQS